MTDHRTAPRNRTFLPARVEIEELGTATTCMIRDLSDTGARLQVSESVALPSAFRLVIPKFDRVVTVQQRWRRGEFVGVEFGAVAGAAPPSTPEQRQLQYIHKLEAEIARLKLLVASIREDPPRALSILDSDAA